jgi:hypothetical protein
MHHRIEVVCTWASAALFLVLLWRFPNEAQWLFSPFRDHLGGG